MIPQFLNFEQFCRRLAVPDPGADHGLLGASGRASRRSWSALQKKREHEFAEQRHGQVAYQYLIDCGALVDPSGNYRPHDAAWQAQRNRVQAQALIANAEQLEQFVRDGWGPIRHARLARAKRAEAERLLKGE